MNTVPDQHERELARAALAVPPTPAEAGRRRDAAVERLRAAREALATEVGGVSAIEALRDDRWSVMHVLTHLGADGGGHFGPVYDMLEHGVRELEPYETREERFAAATEAALEVIDGDIAFAAGLAEEQLLLHARKPDGEHYVVGYVEAAAEHLEAHVAQLRRIKERLAAIRERRQAATAAAGG